MINALILKIKSHLIILTICPAVYLRTAILCQRRIDFQVARVNGAYDNYVQELKNDHHELGLATLSKSWVNRFLYVLETEQNEYDM